MTTKELEEMCAAMRTELDELNALPEIQQYKRDAETRRINLASAQREQEIRRKRETERLEALRRDMTADPLVRVEYAGAGGSGVLLSMRGEAFHDVWTWGVRAADHYGIAGSHARLPTAHHYRRSDWKQVIKESDGEIRRLLKEGILRATELDPSDAVANAEMRTRWERSRVRSP